jgi:hypothetical protein
MPAGFLCSVLLKMAVCDYCDYNEGTRSKCKGG